MRLIRSTSFRRQPWKNGGGETIEIAVSPPKAGTSDFDWRVSMARVEADGPFSAFEGVDRTLTMLDGAGIELFVEGEGPARITGRPHSFPGDLPTSARLINGPILDLNVMSRRSAFVHRVAPFQSSGVIDMVIRAPSAIVYCHCGAAVVEDEFAPPLELVAGNALLIESMPNSLRLVCQGEARLYLIEFSPVKN